MAGRHLEGKAALVVGGAARVGRAISLALAGAGCELAIAYRRSAEAAAETVRNAEALGAHAVAIAADTGRVAECRRLVADAVEALGGVDLLVYAASLWRSAPVLEVDEEHWDAVHSVTLKGAFFTAQAAARSMLEQGSGKIVFVTDVAAYEAWPALVPHATAKAGLAHLTRCLAKALAPTIQVNAVAPGAVLMPKGASEEQVRRSAELAAVKRIGSPEDVADAVLYLASGSGFLTGASLVVDGGRLIS